MPRTLIDLVKIVDDLVDEDYSDYNLTEKIKKFINIAYKEVAKRQRLEKSISVTATDGQIGIPSDFYRISKLLYNGAEVEAEEVGGYISTPIDGDMTLAYVYIPVDLGDNDSPLTNPGNDEALLHYARYLYWQMSDKYSKAEAHLRDFENFKFQRAKKKLQFSVVR